MTAAYAPLLEELRIRSVLEHYCSLLDSGAVDELIELFDENCTVVMMGRTYHGRTELVAAWRQLAATERPATLHALVSPLIEVSGDRATAVSGWAMIDRSSAECSTAVALAGRYHDTLERDGDGRWLFTTRRVQTLARPGA